ncbi:3467_t:CDS:2, partial [Gigaspora margarita]
EKYMLRQDAEQVKRNLQTVGIDKQSAPSTSGIGYTLIKKANSEIQIWFKRFA